MPEHKPSKPVTCPACGDPALLDHFNWITCERCGYEEANQGEVDHEVLPEEDYRKDQNFLN